jgi:hypothetical protein
MANTGTVELNFGAFPGASDASVLVPETGVSNWPTSKAEAWLVPVATADHTADEHWVETIEVKAGPPIAGVGFMVYGKNTNQLTEREPPQATEVGLVVSGVSQPPSASPHHQETYSEGKGTRIWGRWTTAWAWA